MGLLVGRAARGQCLRAATLGWLVVMAGCPRDGDEPERPAGASCDRAEQCNPPGATCGLLNACVDQRCEAQPTLVVPCDGGEPVFVPDAGGGASDDAGVDGGPDVDGGTP